MERILPAKLHQPLPSTATSPVASGGRAIRADNAGLGTLAYVAADKKTTSITRGKCKIHIDIGVYCLPQQKEKIKGYHIILVGLCVSYHHVQNYKDIRTEPLSGRNTLSGIHL